MCSAKDAVGSGSKTDEPAVAGVEMARSWITCAFGLLEDVVDVVGRAVQTFRDRAIRFARFNRSGDGLVSAGAETIASKPGTRRWPWLQAMVRPAVCAVDDMDAHRYLFVKRLWLHEVGR